MTTSFSRSGRRAIASPSASLSSVWASAPCGSGPDVSSIVSIRATWSPPAVAVQSSSSAAIEEREISVRLPSSSSGGDAELVGDLLVGRGAVELPLELADRPLDVAGARPHRARHPVERAQLVDDRALDPRHRVRLELDLAVRVEALDRADQAEQAVRDEVALVDVGGEPAAEPAGDELDERRVGEDQPVAQRPVTRAAVLRARVPGCPRRCSPRVRRIRRVTDGFLRSGRSPLPPGSPARRRARPPRPRSPTVPPSPTATRDQREREREDGEQEPERAPLHAPQASSRVRRGRPGYNSASNRGV